MRYSSYMNIAIEKDDYGLFRLNLYRYLYEKLAREIFKVNHQGKITPSYPIKIKDNLDNDFRHFELQLEVLTPDEYKILKTKADKWDDYNLKKHSSFNS